MLGTDALNINWSGLTAYAYPPMALLHRVIQKIRQSNYRIVELLYRQTALYKSLYWVLSLQQETRRFLTSTINNTALGTF